MDATRCAAQRGFTLVELLVVLLLMGVVGGVAVRAITTSLETSLESGDRIEALHEMEIALQRVSRDLRAAERLQDGFGSRIEARVRRDGELYLMVFRLRDNDGVDELIAERFPIDADDDEPAALSEQTLVTTVDNGSEPIFSYHTLDGEQIECDEAVASCSEAYVQASRVGVNLVRDVRGQRPVEARTSVAVRSIRYRGGS